MIKGEYFGQDGASYCETATRYYAGEEGQVISELWGQSRILAPAEALQNLQGMLNREPYGDHAFAVRGVMAKIQRYAKD